MTHLEEKRKVIELAAKSLDSLKKAHLWYRVPNPMLGNMSPRMMLFMGKGDKLFKWIKAMQEGDLP